MRKAGHVLLDCPVSGTGIQAKVKDLVVYASGGAAEIKRLRPLFADFTRAVHDLGEFGNGSRMKYVANLLVAVHNVASAEALVLGMKAGLPPQLVYDLVRIGAGNSRVFELRAPMMVKGRYDEPTMKVSIWQKDMDVIGSFARELGAPTPLFSATLPIYAAAMSTGYAEQDTAATCAVLEAMAGIKRGKPSGARNRRMRAEARVVSCRPIACRNWPLSLRLRRIREASAMARRRIAEQPTSRLAIWARRHRAVFARRDFYRHHHRALGRARHRAGAVDAGRRAGACRGRDPARVRRRHRDLAGRRRRHPRGGRPRC